MARWQVTGADATSGENISREYDTRTGREAEQRALADGILISSITPVHGAQAPDANAAPESVLSQKDWRRLESTIIKGVAGGILLIWLMNAVLILIAALIYWASRGST